MELNAHGQRVGEVVPGWTTKSAPGRVRLSGRYAELEPIQPRHSRSLYQSLCGPGDESLWTYRPMAMPVSLVDFRELVMRRLVEDGDSATYCVAPHGGTPAGLATFYPCVPASGVVEISSVLWGRGLQRTAAATEAIHLMLVHAFDDLGYRRVEWKCDSLNEPSRRAAERFGFTYEGRFRRHMVIQGRSRDTDWFSMLDSEWPDIRARSDRWLDGENFDASGRQRQSLRDI